jgi:hypothetical protein
MPYNGQADPLDCRVSQTLMVEETGRLLISVIVHRTIPPPVPAPPPAHNQSPINTNNEHSYWQRHG